MQPYLLTLLSATLTFIATWFWLGRAARVKETDRIAAEHAVLVDRVLKLETTLALVNQAVIPINTVMQQLLIKELTHMHTPELDQLMMKIGPPSILTEAEEARLAFLLDERTKDMGDEIGERERGAAMILPEIVKRAKDELIVSAAPVAFQLVTVANPPPEKGY